MATSSTPPDFNLEEWSESLVGKDWEIFWEEEDDNDDEKAAQSVEVSSGGDGTTVASTSTTQQQHAPQLQEPSKVWFCSVCKRPFVDYNEACRHEQQCRQQQHMALIQQQQAVMASHHSGGRPPQFMNPQTGMPMMNPLMNMYSPPYMAPFPSHPQYPQQHVVPPQLNPHIMAPMQPATAGMLPNNPKGEDAKMEEAEDDDAASNNSDEQGGEADVTDWYDATVVGFNREAKVFRVRFVGDDDSVYSMKLTPDIVRPCVRAWAKRSQAILEGQYSGQEALNVDEWEKKLPVDTGTLQDQKYLNETWNKASTKLSNTATTNESLSKDRKDIFRLSFLVQSQIYLRTKLAPTVNYGPGESGVKDSYLDHLVRCLKELHQLCVWYEDCYSLYEQVVSTTTAHANPFESSGDTPLYAPGGSLFNVEYIRGYCLEKGRSMLNSLLAMDFSRAGAKRKPVVVPTPPVARKTKRRKGYKASGFLDSKVGTQGDDDELLEEGEFMSLKSVKKFVGKAHQEKWYVGPFLRMLELLCGQVQEPMRLWKRRVDIIIGVEVDDDDDDSSSSDGATENKDATDKQEGKEEDDEMSDEDETEQFFTFDDVSSCLDNVRNDRVLAKFDLSQWTNVLREKLAGIETFESEVWRDVPHIFDDVGENTKDSDTVLRRLHTAKEAATSTNDHVKNVEPLGCTNSRLTRAVLDNAIAIREWVLDLRHADLVRERLSFVQDVVSRAPNLPHVPSPPHRLVDESLMSAMNARRSQAMSRIQNLSSKLYSHVQAFSRYENIVAEDDSIQLRSKQEVRGALDELRATPVISLVEEKLSVRYDVLKWRDSVQGPLENASRNSLKFDVLEGLKEQLDAVRSGSSPTRSEILVELEKNSAIESDIREFATREIDALCREQSATVERLYFKAKDWKDRADAIILALRIHGNPTAGSSMSGGQKTAAMVDLKRVDDLLADYGNIGSTMDERRTRLSSIRDEAVSWCSSVEKIIGDDSNVRERLTVARDTRPKGVLMDPARHVVDSWVEVLEWHDRVKKALGSFSTSSPTAVASDEFSTLIADKIYPLVLEGQEVISEFGRQVGDGTFVPGENPSALSRPPKAISIEKLRTSTLGNTILSRLIDSGRDSSQGSPLFCLLFLTWRMAVIDLIRRQSATERNTDGALPPVPTLEEAKQLDVLRPRFPSLASETTGDGGLPLFRLLTSTETKEVARFTHLIGDGKRVEASTTEMLSATKDVVRGAFEKTNEVRSHLVTLKELQADFKSRTQDRSGLVLSSSLEQSLDSIVRDVSWLVKTFPYAALHSDIVPEQDQDDDEQPGDSSLSDHPLSVTIPWDVLVALHDRLPNPITGPGGDIARVSLRVEELYEAATNWQNEVTNQMSLSFRGGAKRRAPGTAASEGDDSSKINMGRLDQLASDPILDRVSMPREDAVRRVLDRAREFEESLAGLLNQDFEGSLADKTAYPESDSLVAKNGDFLLYRLTGSSLFDALKVSLNNMSEIAADVLADTPGKVAFDWIVKAVAWIEDLKNAVEEDPSSFKGEAMNKLVIPATDAKRLLVRGNDLFLEFTDDIRRTLAVHKISLSTNKQTERLTVVIGKGGAMHSLGGTAIKWCPLLLEWLKADVERLEDWEAKVTNTAKTLQRMAAKEDASPSYDREAVYRWFQSRENVALLLEEGRDSLVVSPQKQMVSSLQTLQSRLDTRSIDTQMKCQRLLGLDAEALVKGRFEDGGPSVEDRYALQEALLKRRELDVEVSKRKGQKTSRLLTSVAPGPTPRDKARSILERALRKGVQMMGIEEAESSLFCALRACEIEEAMFAAFRQEIGSKSVTNEYRDKLRSMRYNLEDTKNPTLCPRVLAGEITVAQLVKMTSEEMASQKVRLKKARAEEESKKNIILNPGAAKPKDPPTQSVKSLLRSSIQGTAKLSPVNKKPTLKTPPVASLPRQSPPPPSNASDSKLFTTSPSPRQGKSTLKLSSIASQKLPSPPIDTKTARQQAAAFLPTPPSLALTTPPPLAVAAAPAPLPPQSSMCVLNSNGTETFSVSYHDASRRFKTKLVLDDESQRSKVEEFLPELLSEKGRNRIDVFSSFLRSKLDSGRWTAIPMRLEVPASSKADYQKYRRDYEDRERISTISVGESRLFLVTPKFHSAAKPLKFKSRKESYAVLLMRSRQFS